MLGIIIAAGLGSRMGVFSQTRPKCLLPIAGRTLLERTIENLQKAGCRKVIVVVGHKSEMIQHPDIEIVRNDDYSNNNILHSLMYAREHLNGPVIVSYSDIWVEPHIHQKLVGLGLVFRRIVCSCKTHPFYQYLQDEFPQEYQGQVQ